MLFYETPCDRQKATEGIPSAGLGGSDDRRASLCKLYSAWVRSESAPCWRPGL